MRVLCHPDPCVLEHELVARLDAVHPRDASSRTLLLVPTRRLGDHVQRALTAHPERPAWLGVRVLHFRALALSILEAAGLEPPTPLSARLRRALVGRVLGSRHDSLLARFAERRPGAIDRVAASLDELREAGVEPAELETRASGAPAAAELQDLYAAYVHELDRLAGQGHADEAGLVRAALPHAAPFARAHGAIFLHGTYELIGIHLELLRELDRATTVTVLTPAGSRSAATAYAERFARRFLLAPGQQPELIAAPLHGGSGLALDALYDEFRQPEPAASGRFAFRSTQGAAPELEIAARHALAAIADGCPPHEIAIVARSLAPYAAAIDATLGDTGWRFTSPAAVPLRRQPFARDLLLLLQVVDEGFPRRPTAELLRSPRLDWSALIAATSRPRGDLADLWSRRARIVGGLDEWAQELPRWAERADRRADSGSPPSGPSRADRARVIVEALRALDRRAAPAARSWSEHARWLDELLEALLPAVAGAERETLGEILGDMARLDAFDDTRQAVDFRTARLWLEAAVEATALRPYDEERGGIRVLDAMQFRGLTFRRVMILGLNAGVFPRLSSPDPILDDDLRRRLREATGRPLPVRAESVDEERLLVSILLGGSRERAEISWQRSVDAGRSRSLSPALREIARLATGRADLSALRRRGEVPAHPRRWLEHLVEETGALDAEEERLLGALIAADHDSLPAFEARFPELGPGLRMQRAVDAFGPISPEFDARIGTSGIPANGLSVGQLARLGRCPLQFFFADVLGVREVEREAALEIDRREMGLEIHALLADLYATLDREGLLFAARIAEALARARALVAAWRSTLTDAFGERVARHYPVLWEHGGESWQHALLAFLADDLERLTARGSRLEGVERPAEAQLDLGEGRVLPVRGRMDRLTVADGAVVVGDYKSGLLGTQANVRQMLRGRALQVPLYHLLAGRATVELLGVGPLHDPAHSDSRLEFSGFAPDVESGFLETLRVLAGFVAQGRYPLDAQRESCGWCPYTAACRRNEPPARHRERHDGDGRRYAALQKKKTAQPRLARTGERDG